MCLFNHCAANLDVGVEATCVSRYAQTRQRVEVDGQLHAAARLLRVLHNVKINIVFSIT
jgi:hypothetical protein